jgi:hypothetical protein
MPRSSRRLMDYAMRRDGRNPYGSRGGYVTDRGRRDRGRRDARSDYGYNDRQQDMRRGDRAGSRQGSSRDYGYDERDREYDGYFDYGDMRGDMYRPIEAMGYFSGYYGGQDRRRDRGEDYNDYGDYNDEAGDYGETLTKQELKEWEEKLLEEVEEPQEKQFFRKENVEQKARQMGVKMDKPEELVVASLMMYTDYCKALKSYVGNNFDIYIKMGEMFLNDKDSEVKGGEKLALYHDIVSGD